MGIKYPINNTMVLRAVKIRLYPNKQQQAEINKILGSYRYVYNYTLALKNNAYKNDGANLGLKDLSLNYHNILLKQPEMEWLRLVNTKIMKQAIRQMLTAYKNFFNHTAGFPKFKSKKDTIQSALFPIEAISKKNTFNTKHISLITTLKHISFRCSNLQFSRLQRFKDNIRNATMLKTKTGKYFLSVLIEMPDEEYRQFKHTGNDVGIDLGVKDFVITSDGEVFENKRFLTRQKEKIAKLQRQLSKKKKGSKNREKAKIRLAKAFEKQVAQREDYIQKVANSLLSDYDYVFMEDLNVDGMLKSHNLARAISEMGFYRFKTVLVDKASLNGKRVVCVSRWFPSSKRCHNCGYVYRGLTLNEREWICPVCGVHHDRDANAAVNILMEGERIIGVRSTEFTLVENPTMDDKEIIPLKSSGSLKQEITCDKLPIS